MRIWSFFPHPKQLALGFWLFLSTLTITPSLQAAGGSSVISWGFAPAPPASTSNSVVTFDAGNSHSLAVLTNGLVVGWGLNNAGQATPPLSLTDAVAVSAGSGHSLALRADSRVIAWGENSAGQTNVLAGLTNVAAIAAGDFHNLVMLTNGRVFAWGGNASGQSAVPIEFITGTWVAKGIAAGSSHSLAVRRFNNRGLVVGWGNNSSGQALAPAGLRDGTFDVAAVAAGDAHSLALLANGTVRGWGNNSVGQASPPAGLNGVIAIAAGGSDSMALRSNGTVVVWGLNSTASGAVPGGLTNVVAITLGSQHMMALVFRPIRITAAPTNQTVLGGKSATFAVTAQGVDPLSYRWQRNGTNLLGRTAPTLTLENVQLADAGTYTVQISSPNGASNSASATLTVNSAPFITQPPASTNLDQGQSVTLQIVAGGSGTLRYQWRKNGQNLAGAVNTTHSIFGAQPSDAGNYDVVVTNIYGAVTSAVAVVSVNQGPQAPVITQQPQSQDVVAGSSVSFTVTASFATSYQWRKDGVDLGGATSPTYSISGVQLSDAGGYQVRVSNPASSVNSAIANLIVSEPSSTSSNVVVWGQVLVFVGDGYVDMRAPPGLNDAIALAGGLAHNLALREDQTVTGWGDNSLSQSAPPIGLSDVAAIAAGAQHSLALRNDGTVAAWGANNLGQITPPGGLTDVIAIAAGANHSLALRSNGIVSGWGANSFGQATAPPNTPTLIGIAAGGDFSLGLKADRTVTGWGENEYGQTRPPAGLQNVVALAAGQSHAAALRADGTVIAWGRNQHGQTNVPAGLTAVSAIACGAHHCLALQSNGVVVAWGQNNEGQLETPGRLLAAAIAASSSRSLAVRLRQYELLSITPRPAGGWRLSIGHNDDTPVVASELNGIEVRTTSDLSQPISNWVRLISPISLQDGVAHIEDNRSDLIQRFYIVIDRP